MNPKLVIYCQSARCRRRMDCARFVDHLLIKVQSGELDFADQNLRIEKLLGEDGTCGSFLPMDVKEVQEKKK